MQPVLPVPHFTVHPRLFAPCHPCSPSSFHSVLSIMNVPWCSAAHLSGHLRAVCVCAVVHVCWPSLDIQYVQSSAHTSHSFHYVLLHNVHAHIRSSTSHLDYSEEVSYLCVSACVSTVIYDLSLTSQAGYMLYAACAIEQQVTVCTV